MVAMRLRHRMAVSVVLFLVILVLLLVAVAEAKDLYKILGVDKGASQRDIQKAFHKLSLKFHPDKNPSADAQAKFSEISNAYDILSDEEKRKQYDLFGDEPRGYPNRNDGRGPFGGSQSSQGWDDVSGHNNGGPFYRQTYTHGSQEGSKGFHFHFGGRPQAQEFTDDISFPSNFGGFDFMQNMFGNLFKSGRGSGSSKQKYGGSFDPRHTGRDSRNKNFKLPKEIEQLTPSGFKQVLDGSGETSMVFFYLPESVDLHEKSAVLEEVAKSLNGVVKVRAINCQLHKNFCEEQAVWPSKQSRLMIYMWRRHAKKNALEYKGNWNAQAITAQCVQLLPQTSTSIPADNYDILFQTSTKLPRALLLTKKKETPPIWRAISGAFENRVVFYDAQVHDVTDPIAKRFAIKNLPAVVGILSDGQEVLLTGENNSGSVKVEELKALIEKLEVKNKGAHSNTFNRQYPADLQFITKDNFARLCGVDTPLCVIAAAKSSKGQEKAKNLLEKVSQKNFVRAGSLSTNAKKPSISYALLDASKQKAFLEALRESNFRNDIVFVAYKPRKGKFAILQNPATHDAVETFVTEALSGDLSFKKVKKEPMFS
ncbi:hypothetical protein O6H91_08G021900 [Diphasiastrum complanatum]|nr:hypothetical protein O6H91_08G021900 [Diphasiastrum complanatum]